MPQRELITNTDTLGPVFENPEKQKTQESMRETLVAPGQPILPPDLVPLKPAPRGRGLLNSPTPSEGAVGGGEPTAPEIYFEDLPEELDIDVESIDEEP